MHRRILLGAMALSAAACLPGCVAVTGALGASVNAYDGPTRKDADIAILVHGDGPVAYGTAYVKAIDDVDYGDDFLKGWPSTVKVIPGTHNVSVKCMVMRKYAFPSIHVQLKAGIRYEVGCTDLGNGFASAKVEELRTGSN